jgi:5-enolpyruvylshikimate-3-phosphate synthase
VKESDRIRALVTNLEAVGVVAVEHPDMDVSRGEGDGQRGDYDGQRGKETVGAGNTTVRRGHRGR